MKRITPRTCLWPLTGVLSITFAVSISLTYRSNHHCYAGTCGEWLFPQQARLHVVVWYMWLALSVTLLGVRAFQPAVRSFVSKSTGIHTPFIRKNLRLSGLLLVLWVIILYAILIGIWWIRLRDYFKERGEGLPGNNLVAAVALTGHLADVTMGMVLLPVSRHSALASFFKLSPTTTYTFHLTQAYVLFSLILVHGSLYAAWAALYNQNRNLFRHILPVLNPTYLYNEVWPGSTSSLGKWRASLIFTGILSSLIMLAMLLTSFPVVRRKYFNLFYFTHLFGIAAVVIICLHASTMLYCTIPGLSMWLLDWSMRILELRHKLDSRLKSLGSGWYCLTLPLPHARLSGCACHSPLAHFYVHHSASSIREIHPFTTITYLASEKSRARLKGEDTISIQFLFRPSAPLATYQGQEPAVSRKSMQWTNKLASLVDEETGEFQRDGNRIDMMEQPRKESIRTSDSGVGYEVDTTLRLEGPYFTPVNPERYKTVVCLVAGTGLSGALAIAAAFKAQRARLQSEQQTPLPTDGGACVIANDNNGVWTRCIVIWSVREKDYVDLPFIKDNGCAGFEFQINKTGRLGQARIDLHKQLAAFCDEQGKDTWCYISGPSGFIDAAEQACDRIDGLTRFAARWD